MRKHNLLEILRIFLPVAVFGGISIWLVANILLISATNKEIIYYATLAVFLLLQSLLGLSLVVSILYAMLTPRRLYFFPNQRRVVSFMFKVALGIIGLAVLFQVVVISFVLLYQ